MLDDEHEIGKEVFEQGLEGGFIGLLGGVRSLVGAE
jgi:hypothetical protein